jgi:hypothetical protein
MWLRSFHPGPFEPQERAASESLASTTRRIFIFALLVFCSSPISVLSDGQYSILLSDSIIHYHSTHLNAYRFPGTIWANGRCGAATEEESHSSDTYQLARFGKNVVYCYPNGSSILSIPFVALMSAVAIRPASTDGNYDYAGEAKIERLLAAILMAVLTCVVFRTSLLLLDRRTSIVVAFGLAFGTQVWSTASRTLWSHTWLIFLAGWAAYLIMRYEHEQKTLHPIILATLLSWMYFVRPTGAVAIVCIAVYVLVCDRREIYSFTEVGVLWLAGFVVYSWFTFGRLIPNYYLDFHSRWSQFPGALSGTLISPSRGLLVFVPTAIFVFYLLGRYWSGIPSRRVAMLCLAIILIHILLTASWRCWWGGYSYGPRLGTDFVPWLALLAILGLAARSAEPQVRLRRLEAVVGLFLLTLGVVVNGRGAMCWSTFRWNRIVDVDFHPYRVFDWSYPQFMAGLISSPPYVREKTRSAN